jgi:hypothetical protein
VENEGYSIIQSMIRLEHSVGGRHASLYTDHSNLVHIFDPYGEVLRSHCDETDAGGSQSQLLSIYYRGNRW